MTCCIDMSPTGQCRRVIQRTVHWLAPSSHKPVGATLAHTSPVSANTPATAACHEDRDSVPLEETCVSCIPQSCPEMLRTRIFFPVQLLPNKLGMGFKWGRRASGETYGEYVL